MALRERAGKWHYRFEVDGHEWAGNTGLVATERNRTSALRIELEARKMIEQGSAHLLKIQAIPFSEAAVKFIEWCKAAHREKPNTWKRTKGSMSTLKVHFGRSAVSAITQGDVADYIAWRANVSKVRDITIRHDLHNLSKFFQYAIKHNWRRDNPVSAEDIPSDQNAVRMHIFTPAEEALYLVEAERFPKLLALVQLMKLQGCRPEELLATPVENVDFERNHLWIQKSKTAAGKRKLRIRPESLEVLAQLVRDAQGPYLFSSERHERKQLSLSTCENWHAKVRKAAGLHCVLYDWRHTFATRSANAGMSLATLARILGHSSLRSVMKYVHPSQEDQDRAMDQLSNSTQQPDQNRTKSVNVRNIQ